MKSNKKMMQQKSPHVKRHNGPLAFTRAENAINTLKNTCDFSHSEGRNALIIR
jgi:hypothetical protein